MSWINEKINILNETQSTVVSISKSEYVSMLEAIKASMEALETCSPGFYQCYDEDKVRIALEKIDALWK